MMMVRCFTVRGKAMEPAGIGREADGNAKPAPLDPNHRFIGFLSDSFGYGVMMLGAKVDVGDVGAVLAVVGIGALMWCLRCRKTATNRAAKTQHSLAVERLSLAARYPFDCPNGEHAAGCPLRGDGRGRGPDGPNSDPQ
ncbi:uncharacterized protein K452DRAFT_171845 [Aplosporella prunicola CBS 121167]|uniref:Uncharacterized protein n=1 Tax=Aplosporella prunicola CBS 121167 TaxID=1176127 RepID=A0A6A6BH82_9PEZI|nr:uncharacterized protein K452DRAFT_171845 [Aplosporella prunicola CBS 121167]KAF2143490.1 hypothetical protein K452DRAFT_171845 [Aplosporella prunicola CBS 121167]